MVKSERATALTEPTTAEDLEVDAARGIRVVHIGNRVVERPIAATLEEARAKGWDYFDPKLGWIRRGRKREQEYPENRAEE